MIGTTHGYPDRMAKDISAMQGGGIVLVYYGTNLEQLNKVRRGASNSKDKGVRVRGMIQADNDGSFGQGGEYFVIYANGAAARKKG